MRADQDIKRDVRAELDWDPDAKDITVKVDDGVVTLSGCTRSLFQKHEAARTAQCVPGVTAVTNDVVVRSGDESSRAAWCVPGVTEVTNNLRARL